MSAFASDGPELKKIVPANVPAARKIRKNSGKKVEAIILLYTIIAAEGTSPRKAISLRTPLTGTVILFNLTDEASDCVAL